jgi:tRNA dimethylallyltransferase
MLANSPPILHLCGPTASGKSQLAEQLHQHFDVELISVDSALIYRGMDIGSAKPDAVIQQSCRYHVLDLIDPEQSYSAAQFVSDANRAIAAIHARGRIPVLVGGTMLYFRALIQGLSDLPATDPALRALLRQELATRGLAELHAELARVDPLAAARIHPNDPQRILRALEVFRQTGQPMSSQQQAWRDIKSVDPTILRIALYPDRAWLHERIALRFEQMLAMGFLDEVRALMRRPGLTLDHPAMRAVGYRQAWQHLSGEFDLGELKLRGVAATRQLAKRQITWIRSDPGLLRLEGDLAQNFDALCHALIAYTTKPATM